MYKQLYMIVVDSNSGLIMGTTTLSIRIRKELKEKMEKLKEINWREEIEKFIEAKIREVELRRIVSVIDDALKNVPPSSEPTWKDIRENRESR